MSMLKQPGRKPLAIALGAAFAVAAGSAGAQVEEIIVTAQKRAESSQDVPIAIQAFSGEALQEMGVSSSAEVLNNVANATLNSQGGSKQNYFIRGVGTADFHLNVVGAVGVYRDEVSVNSPFAVNFAAFDLERVEVLRGPQNTLFGRNTTGGAVTYVSNKPVIGGGLKGYGEFTYGRYDQIDGEGAVGFDLGPTAAARISLFSNNRDSPWNNLNDPTIENGEIDRRGGRGQVLWQVTDDLLLHATVHGGVSRGTPGPTKQIGTQDPANRLAPCPIPLTSIELNSNCADASGFVHQYNDWEDTYQGMENMEDVDLWGASVKGEWQWHSLTITSISAYDFFSVDFKEDTDGAPNTIFQFNQQGEYDQLSQDLRIQSSAEQELRWIVGFYYFFEEGDYSTAVRRTPAPGAPSAPGSFNVIPNTQVFQDNEVFSAYFQGDYDLSETLTATFGYRWTRETKSGWNAPSVRCAGVGGPPFCPVVDEDAFIDRDLILSLPALATPPIEKLDQLVTEKGLRGALNWQVTDDALLYASISRGFKSGGFSLAALQALTGNAAQSVEPETLWAYEVGAKSEWFDRTLQVNGAVFFYRWDNLQSFQALLNPATGIAFPQLLNVPEAELIGAELETQWAPGMGWFVQAGVGFSDGQITDATNVIGTSVGNTLPSTPKWTFNGLVRKEWNVAGGLASLQSMFRYQDETHYDLPNQDILTQDGYWDVGARAAYRFGPDERYEVAGWGKNLTGEETCTGMVSLQGLAQSIECFAKLSEPTYGVTASVRFE